MKPSLIFSALMMLAFVLMLAPNVLAINRGKLLRNIAIWLGIFAGLGLVYNTFGPGGRIPIIAPSSGIVAMQPQLGHNVSDTVISITPPSENKTDEKK